MEYMGEEIQECGNQFLVVLNGSRVENFFDTLREAKEWIELIDFMASGKY